MGDLIKTQKPKGIEYIEKLLQYQEPSNLFDKAKSYFSPKNVTEANSISQWCRILGSTDNNTNTRNFLEKLVEKDALIEEGTKGQPPNQTKVYSLDKDRLLKCYRDSSDYKMRIDLIKKTINKAESDVKIIRDF